MKNAKQIRSFWHWLVVGGVVLAVAAHFRRHHWHYDPDVR
jgi:hypothetical protein